VRHERGADGVPAEGFTFFAESDQTLVGVEVAGLEGERAAASARGFGVHAQNQSVQRGIVAGGRGYLVDLGKTGVGDGAAGGR
jgi:hypothetical protein